MAAAPQTSVAVVVAPPDDVRAEGGTRGGGDSAGAGPAEPQAPERRSSAERAYAVEVDLRPGQLELLERGQHGERPRGRVAHTGCAQVQRAEPTQPCQRSAAGVAHGVAAQEEARQPGHGREDADVV